MFKKMALIEPRLLERLQAPECKAPTNPTVKAMCSLDRDMQDILDRDDLSEADKMREYNAVLQRYLTYANKYDNRPPVKVQIENTNAQTDRVDQSDKSVETPFEKEVLETVPDKMKKKAKLLLGRIRASSVMDWNDRGELVYEGKALPGSNVADLVNDVLRQRKHFNPKGWEIFAQGLKETNVPQELVGHQGRWDYMQNPVDSPIREDAGFYTPKQSSKKKKKGQRLPWSPY